MIRLFISYTQSSTGEYALARALESRLRERGVEVFRDETSVSAGERWKDILRERLTVWATHVLFIVSDTALSREFVQYEMQQIQERIASDTGLTVLWLSFNRESGLPHSHWLHAIQSVRVPGKQPPHVTESEWVSAVEGSLGLRLGVPGLSAAVAEYIEKKTSGFVGRRHVFAEIAKFLRQERSGYLTLTGEPGIGKTAILCELAKRERCVAHFFVRTAGITRVDHMYEAIGKQLHDRYGIGANPGSHHLWSLTFGRWLAEAKTKLGAGDKLLIVIDAVDECDDLQSNDGPANMLSLPRILPPGVYCVLSRRELDPARFNLQIETEPDVGNSELDLMKWTDDNARDIDTFLRAHFESRPDHPWLIRHQQTVEQAVSLLGKRSDGNFMYLRYMLPQIADHPDEFSPGQLPRGLQEYYRGHWKRMVSRWKEDSHARYVFDVIYLMVVDHAPRTVRQLAGILDLPIQQVRLLIQQWREFLEEDVIGDETGFRIYHWSFAEFLEHQDPVIDAADVVGPVRKAASAQIQNYIFNVLFGRHR
jgi:hypothetical protein